MVGRSLGIGLKLFRLVNALEAILGVRTWLLELSALHPGCFNDFVILVIKCTRLCCRIRWSWIVSCMFTRVSLIALTNSS